jgi:hypothetical protein
LRAIRPGSSLVEVHVLSLFPLTRHGPSHWRYRARGHVACGLGQGCSQGHSDANFASDSRACGEQRRGISESGRPSPDHGRVSNDATAACGGLQALWQAAAPAASSEGQWGNPQDRKTPPMKGDTGATGISHAKINCGVCNGSTSRLHGLHWRRR